MSQSLADILVHMIFSTKDRVPLIRTEVEKDVYVYIAAVLKDIGSPALTIGGTADHIHILCTLARTATVAGVIEKVKKTSSKWIKTKGAEYAKFYWQGGYGAFSIGRSGKADLIHYIANQKEHHRKMTFQEEYRAILKKYGVAYDERYVWD